MTATSPLTLGRAWDLSDRLLASIALACPDLHIVEPAGDMRRAEPLVGAIVLVGCTANPAAAIDALEAQLDLLTINSRSANSLSGTYQHSVVEILIAQPHEFGSMMLEATGPDAHVRELFRRGLSHEPFATERDLYTSISLPFIAPELRKGTEEIDAAAADRLPHLLEQDAIRGDLHMHTVYSDGRDSVATMIEECAVLGYEYMAITDHSAGASASRTLAIDEIARQRDEIESMRERFPRMTILHGAEVDVLPDGRLDFADDILEQFDIVLASMHERDRQSPRQLTKRTLEALAHPLVNILCHPANRLVGRSAGYALDFDAIYAAAAESGTALEVDGAPSHIDLDGDRARAAAAAGATLVVDSDCHRVEALRRQMGFGVGTARRGWIEPNRVLNTRSIEEVLVFIAAKRAR
ncbi:MAG TPA: PHP domain-containing protein [Vicinamibacterales bacterium]